MIPPPRIFDLTHPLDESTIHWPGDQGFTLRNDFDGMIGPGRYYYGNTISMSEHAGTHIDAPRHMNREGLTVDAIPLDQLIGPGVRVDVSRECARKRDYLIPVAQLVAWENRNGLIPLGGIVLLHTGHGRYLPDRAKYLGTSRPDSAENPQLHFPGLAPEAARWLIDERRIRAIGIDCPGIDPGRSTTFETHRLLFEHNIPTLENLANLDQLPPIGFTVIALPLKIKGGSGAPVRIIALAEAAATTAAKTPTD